MRFFVPFANDESLTGRLSYNFERQENKRSIQSAFAQIRFVPFQKSKGKIKRIRAVFFKAHPCGTVQRQDFIFGLFLPHERAEAFILKFMVQEAIDIRIFCNRNKVVFNFFFAAIEELDNFELFLGGKCIFQRSQIIANQLDGLARRPEIQKRISKRHVQELVLPNPLLAMLYRAFAFIFFGNINFFRSAPRRLILFFRFRQFFKTAFRIILPLRNRANRISKASLLDIDKELEIAIVQKMIFCSIDSFIKINLSTICK